MDQIDISNLAGCEVLARHSQYLEIKKNQDAKRYYLDSSEFSWAGSGELVGPSLRSNC